MGAPRRVLRGQVALVYGLLLVGCTYKDACETAGVDRKVMRHYITPSWRRARLAVATKLMTPVQRSVYRNVRELYGRDRALAELSKIASPQGAAAPNKQEM